VKDNGAGIAEKDQQQLFTIFHRVDDSGNIPGTGLGLHIVKRYVQLMGGTLSFYSRPQEETCFEMTFPVNRGAFSFRNAEGTNSVKG
jgi:signal transduction histidine kinase